MKPKGGQGARQVSKGDAKQAVGEQGGVLTYADDVHEAVHAVADLEEEILALPLG